ncbi:hypothetical protein D3C75_1380610 [compost metagenome]
MVEKYSYANNDLSAGDISAMQDRRKRFRLYCAQLFQGDYDDSFRNSAATGSDARNVAGLR